MVHGKVNNGNMGNTNIEFFSERKKRNSPMGSPFHDKTNNEETRVTLIYAVLWFKKVKVHCGLSN